MRKRGGKSNIPEREIMVFLGGRMERKRGQRGIRIQRAPGF
jgi:hypothetical protein